jgi:hypothetical protein
MLKSVAKGIDLITKYEELTRAARRLLHGNEGLG